jgi:excisionase family DNA binding protein
MALLTMSVREAAEALGASTTAVRRWIKSGELPAVRIGGRIFITHDGLRKRLEIGHTQVDSPNPKTCASGRPHS